MPLIPNTKLSYGAGCSYRARCDLSGRYLKVIAKLVVVFVGLGVTASCSTPADWPLLGELVAPHDGADQAKADQFRLMLKVLKDSNLDTSRRRQAAQTMVESRDPRAVELLAIELGPQGDPATRRLIIQVLVATRNTPAQGFAQVLFRSLSQVDEQLLGDIAAVLGRYEDNKLVEGLVKLALDRSAKSTARSGAVLTLGYHRSREVAGVLVGLLATDHPSAVRQAAYDALSQLTGIEGYDKAQWEQWWAENRKLSNRRWQESLIKSLTRQNTRFSGQTRHIQERLTDVQRQFYRATPQADRPALLLTMLNDPLDVIRRLAIDLCVQRLIDRQPITSPLREALLARLDDRSPIVRERATLLLRDLADEAAADAVAGRLASAKESHPAVLRAYLLMMTRLPRAEAVDGALQRLADPHLGGESAGVLAACADAGLLNAQQTAQAAERVRRRLDADPSPQPNFVALLGRVGSDEDWDRIAKWIGSDDAAVKRTAAQAWADSRRPLQILLEYAGDPVIGQTVIAAARRRGFQPETLMALIEHKPSEQGQVIQAWQAAVVAVAGRLSPSVVLEAHERLVGQGESLKLQDEFLSAAVDRWAPNNSFNGVGHSGAGPDNGQNQQGTATNDHAQNLPKIIDLVLLRAGVRLGMNDPGRALADYQRLDTVVGLMDVSQQDRYQLGVLGARLAGGEIEQAFEWARWCLDSRPATEDTAARAEKITELFLALARRGIETGQTPQAAAVLTGLRQLLGPSILEATRLQIDELERELGLNLRAASGSGGRSVTGLEKPVVKQEPSAAGSASSTELKAAEE